MRTTNNYTTESLARALDVHKAHGSVIQWLPPEAGRPRWHIYIPGNFLPFEWTAPQVYAFCIGCAETWNLRDKETRA